MSFLLLDLVYESIVSRDLSVMDLIGPGILRGSKNVAHDTGG
jgi:hypothetical protein